MVIARDVADQFATHIDNNRAVLIQSRSRVERADEEVLGVRLQVAVDVLFVLWHYVYVINPEQTKWASKNSRPEHVRLDSFQQNDFARLVSSYINNTEQQSLYLVTAIGKRYRVHS